MIHPDKRQTLFDAARAIFSEQGFKKTNIAAITNRANVAVGTFYKYYTSKEQIFCEVYLAENEQAKRKIISQIDTDQSPKEVVRQFFEKVLQIGKHNAILAEWYQNTEISQLIMEHNQDSDDWQNSFVYSFLIDSIKRWRESGQFRQDIDLDTMISLFKALVVVDIHHDEIDSQNYPQVIKLLAEIIVDGLSAES
ncbi:TetR/AcrR family transcriptional regulator [Fredinandcohnia sp. QZ13]|uniref:TetR/AcrR family transcriptional regulator n=1 Tax=Fredinandcohnia sp. QZ13 TaxID=3073144 RepID=UPI0028535025|nr:TetR/AcrR family transcriptional regulator [Fredinandcohnia sp. QZ13]MDR4887883.1 TetR/AcrR family transcriptional regulator [Fredinandcohnia sp. QZ13]